MLSPRRGSEGDTYMHFLLTMKKGVGEFKVPFTRKHSFPPLVSGNSLWSLLQNLSFGSWSVI